MSDVTSSSQINPHYTNVAIILHWLIALAVISMLALGIYMEELKEASDPRAGTVFQWHKSIGISILFLTIARIIWRVLNPPPPLPPMPKWQEIASKAVHYAFYALLLLLPLSGWFIESSSSYPSGKFFYVVPWPHIPGIHAQQGLHEFGEDIHGIMAKLLVALLVLHIAAALKHQFIDKDNLVERIWPGSGHSTDWSETGRKKVWLAFGGALAGFALVVVSGLICKPASGAQDTKASASMDKQDDDTDEHHHDYDDH